MSVNRVIIMGKLGFKPEIKYTQSGTAITNLSVATNEYRTDKEGARHEKTEWHKVVVFGKTAENTCAYLDKGSTVYIEGRLTNREYKNKTGQQVFVTEITADDVKFLDKKAQS